MVTSHCMHKKGETFIDRIYINHTGVLIVMSSGVKHGQIGSQESQMYIEILVVLLIPVFNFLWTCISECLNSYKFVGVTTNDLAWSTILKSSLIQEKDGRITTTPMFLTEPQMATFRFPAQGNFVPS